MVEHWPAKTGGETLICFTPPLLSFLIWQLSCIVCLSCFVASIAAKLRLQGISDFELSPGPPPFTVAAYVPGSKVGVLCFVSEFCTFWTVKNIKLRNFSCWEFFCANKKINCWYITKHLFLSHQGAPSYVRLFRHPNFDNPASVLANKSFFKADRVKLMWNKKGLCCILCIKL